MSSESRKTPFRLRLEQIVDDEPFKWAKRAGIAPATFNRAWTEGIIPKTDTLIRISEFSGVSLDWLIAGVGDMKRDVATQERPAHSTTALVVDGYLLGRITELIMQVHEGAGIALPKFKIGEIAARIYADLAGTPTSEEGREAQLALVRTQMQVQLREAQAKPGTGKRTA